MKCIEIILLLTVFALCGCSDQTEEATVIVEADDQPTRAIRIVVEDGDDVVIEDPYIEEIEAISAAYMQERARYLNERESMTPEERAAFGDLRRSSNERIRALQAQRKQYIIEQMKQHQGVRFVVEADGARSAAEETVNYFKGLQESQPSEE